MKITFDSMQEQNIQARGSMEKNYAPAQDMTKKAERAGAFTVQIGGQDTRRTENGTYKKENMTAEEISLQASGTDMDVQKMYMAVMSNSMSQEEFHKMLEDGVNVSDTDVETLVTILDQIKVAVAKGGTEIAGFTDNVSEETLEQILGSSAYAQVLEEGLEEDAAAYMVKQQMAPTAENLYRAKYSVGAYRGQKEAEMPDRESAEGKVFWEQIDKIIRETGLTANEESRDDAAFLLKHEIPLTKESLQLYEKIKAFQKGEKGFSEDELKDRIAMQVYEGKAAYQADLSEEESIYERALNLYEAVREIEPEAVERAVQNHFEGTEFTLKELSESRKVSESTVKGKDTQAMEDTAVRDVKTEQKTGQSAELLTARRQLEEIRLRMSVEANIKLLRSGFQIDTEPMEKLIERLREAEEELAGQGIFQAQEAAEKINELRTMPMAALGFVVNREISFTIEAIYEKGSELQAGFERENAKRSRLEAAKERYETMQTEVRADLGDSIRKAFRNVDDILADMNKEPSEENRRAMRMLGYNRIEITQENLQRALDIDEKVQNLFRDMKPGKVLQMIRDGVDVLHTDIGELDAYLTVKKSEFAEESEDFARFLHKLDKNGSITEKERENYIGIYRLIRQVEKSDGRAQGYLLGSEAQLTLENLLTAVRSGRKGFMDYRMDENFSGVDALQKGKNILEQITAVSYEDERGYEEIMQTLEGAGQKGGQTENKEADFLKEMYQPVTVANLLEASAVLQEEAGLYQRLEDYEKAIKQEETPEEEQSRLERYVTELQDSADGEVSLQEGMELFAKRAEELLREAGEQEGVTELDIRDMQRIYRGVRFRTTLAKENCYQIPVKLEEGYAVMNLTVRRGVGRAQAEISLDTEKYGRLEALFTESGQPQDEAAGIKAAEGVKTGISGSLFAETESGTALLTDISERIQKRFEDAGIPAKEIAVMRGSRLRSGASHGAAGSVKESIVPERGAEAAERKTDGKEISAGELYKIAKIFLETVRNET